MELIYMSSVVLRADATVTYRETFYPKSVSTDLDSRGYIETFTRINIYSF